MTYEYDLRVGLPHTNFRGLSEALLLMHAGHLQWTSIASAAGMPLSQLRTLDGGEVYATFYFIEECLPAHTALEGFGLDDELRFRVSLRAFKNISVEGRIMFDRAGCLGLDTPDDVDGTGHGAIPNVRHPWIHFGNIFITPVQGNSLLRVAPPANADFTRFPPLPNAENPYHITRAAGTSGDLQLLDPGWSELCQEQPFEWRYAIDVDRDTNGAGLVYFANYVSFMESAERHALGHWIRDSQRRAVLETRSLRRRRIAYYGNADVSDTVRTRVRLFMHPEHPELIGFRYAIRREQDAALICLAESIKIISLPS